MRRLELCIKIYIMFSHILLVFVPILNISFFLSSVFPSLILYVQYTDSVNVRLVNGTSRCAGKVAVHHRGQWGTLCNENWDMADAAVVCRELDCGEPVDALGGDHFGPASGPIWMSTVMCTGSESTLKNCGSGGGFRYDCRNSGNAAVICSGKLLQTCPQ